MKEEHNAKEQLLRSGKWKVLPGSLTDHQIQLLIPKGESWRCWQHPYFFAVIEKDYQIRLLQCLVESDIFITAF